MLAYQPALQVAYHLLLCQPGTRSLITSDWSVANGTYACRLLHSSGFNWFLHASHQPTLNAFLTETATTTMQATLNTM